VVVLGLNPVEVRRTFLLSFFDEKKDMTKYDYLTLWTDSFAVF
jgi:hypothetical protein